MARTLHSQLGFVYVSFGDFLRAGFEAVCKIPSRSYLAILLFGLKHFELCPLLLLRILSETLEIGTLFFRLSPNSATNGK